MNTTQKALLYGAAVLACLAVFGLYLKPEFMVTLAGQMWACF
jgi:uncharacterized membrane protein